MTLSYFHSLHYYLIHIQYLGFRFRGWAKQPGIKTVHHMIDRSINYVLGGEQKFKTLGTSRTDAMVSANHTVFELFMDKPIEEEQFLSTLNENLPSDIRAISIAETTADFNVIQHPKTKEYLYLFAFGEKHHPFAASMMALFPFDLDITLMKKGALLFEGTHNFKKFCYKPSEHTSNFERHIDKSYITENTLYTANFFPEHSFAFHVHGKGFMRYQIRLMMGQLIRLGRGECSLQELKEAIEQPQGAYFSYAAPASGLILHKINFDED